MKTNNYVSWTVVAVVSFLAGELVAVAQYVEQQKLTASDAAQNDRFGSVAIDGNTAVVGAFNKGDTSSHYGAGAAWVFQFNGVSWGEVARLTSSDLARDDEFGGTVAIDGDVIVVSAIQHNESAIYSGAAYVFVRPPDGWESISSPITETTKLSASDGAWNDYFSVGVAIDNDTIVAGALFDDDDGSNSGSAYVFDKPVAGWGSVTSPIYETAKLTASDAQALDRFGDGVAIEGYTIVVGASQNSTGRPGAAYVFERQAGTWIELAKLLASDGAVDDRFGYRLGMQGDTIVIGAIFDDDSGNNSGSAYMFEKPVAGWDSVPSPIHETAKLTASDGAPGDTFGNPVAIDLAGTVVVGALWHDTPAVDSGAAYAFQRPAGGWASTASPIHESAKLSASDGASGDKFGSGVSVSGDLILVGSSGDDHAGGTDAGSAYVFSCLPPDTDGDGVPDEVDVCPDSDLSDTVLIDVCDTGVINQLFDDGCTMADRLAQCTGAIVNNAVFVCCVAHLTNEWKDSGLISGADKGPIQSCAARADIP